MSKGKQLTRNKARLITGVIVVATLLVGICIYCLVHERQINKVDTKQSTSNCDRNGEYLPCLPTTPRKSISSYEDCVAAGYPTVCRVPGGVSFPNPAEHATQ